MWLPKNMSYTEELILAPYGGFRSLLPEPKILEKFRWHDALLIICVVMMQYVVAGSAPTIPSDFSNTFIHWFTWVG